LLVFGAELVRWLGEAGLLEEVALVPEHGWVQVERDADLGAVLLEELQRRRVVHAKVVRRRGQVWSEIGPLARERGESADPVRPRDVWRIRAADLCGQHIDR